jgi:hypothetical protein
LMTNAGDRTISIITNMSSISPDPRLPYRPT